MNLLLRRISRSVLALGLVYNLFAILPAFHNQSMYTLIDLVLLLPTSNIIYLALFILTFTPRTQFFQALLLLITNVGFTAYFLFQLIIHDVIPTKHLTSDAIFIFEISSYIQLIILIPLVIIYLILYWVIHKFSKYKDLQKET